MPTPGFRPHTLDGDGCPSWISGLATADPNHIVHVVKGLEPAEVLEMLGAEPSSVQTCELPGEKPNEWTSLPEAALGADGHDSPEDADYAEYGEPASAAGTLLAGSIGAWTFIYDDAGATVLPGTTAALAGHRRTAATSRLTLDGDTSVIYAVDAEELASINVDDLDLEADLPNLPPNLRAAFAAAGTIEDDGEPDPNIGMRAVCALAGLQRTLKDLRQTPLLVARMPLNFGY
ncbi:hypothetical protein GCM10027570_00770 [Streptomonospora sediminis]